MENKDEKVGSQFIVDLGDIKLPSVIEKRVEAEIQAIVLRALAENGASDNQLALSDRLSIPVWDRFPGHTAGMWFGDRDLAPTIQYDRIIVK
jgi:hypothetical protein